MPKVIYQSNTFFNTLVLNSFRDKKKMSTSGGSELQRFIITLIGELSPKLVRE